MHLLHFSNRWRKILSWCCDSVCWHLQRDCKEAGNCAKASLWERSKNGQHESENSRKIPLSYLGNMVSALCVHSCRQDILARTFPRQSKKIKRVYITDEICFLSSAMGKITVVFRKKCRLLKKKKTLIWNYKCTTQ